MIDERGQFPTGRQGPGHELRRRDWAVSSATGRSSLGHFFKVVYADPGLVWPQYRRGCSPHGSGCKSPWAIRTCAEPAEYLRVGTTLLVLDASRRARCPACRSCGGRSARCGRSAPIRRSPSACRCPAGGTPQPWKSSGFISKRAAAISIAAQRCAAGGPRHAAPLGVGAGRFGRRSAVARGHARLGHQAVRARQGGPRRLVGRPQEDRHPLSRAFAAGLLSAAADDRHRAELLDRTEIDHARRNPPAGTPAAVRGRYIREFARRGRRIGQLDRRLSQIPGR